MCRLSDLLNDQVLDSAVLKTESCLKDPFFPAFEKVSY